MHKYAIIVAGGEGNRAGGSVPKQFQSIYGIPMLWWSVRAFHAEDSSTSIIIVMHPGFIEQWERMRAELPAEDREIEYKIVCGGANRCESVINGLSAIDVDSDSLVAVHDAARPMITADLIRRGWECAKMYDTAIPVVEMTDSIRKIEEGKNISVSRSEYVKVHTPQIFATDLLKCAYSSVETSKMTDDASVVEAFGHKVTLYPGDSVNFKVTNPEDIKIASFLKESICGYKNIHEL